MPWFLTAARRRARLDAAVDAVEQAAVDAQAQAERLADAIAVAHRALALLESGLVALADQPARAEAALAAADARAADLLDHARREIGAATAVLGAQAAERVAVEIAPARAAAEEHAAWLRASLDRLRGETAALGGAEDAAAALVGLSGTVQAGLTDTLAALTRRSDAAADAAERAAARLHEAAERADPPRRRRAPVLHQA